MSDKVMHPKSTTRVSGVGDKQVKSGIIEGPTASSDNLTPYNKSKKGK